ncbi:Ribonuclease R [Candidatus Gullanella endobia]|uniref:Ribonuclease R n=1 Tax=Candidatus Gullanella endobia TaxID=1070130 RepID=A0A143WRA4_9ENTR|nr:ribonuclease R [Candidatus Gullanella endobia]CUX96131.1 Ribonuclease R [Candidatus Gullanella endobia]
MLQDPFFKREKEKYIFPVPSREFILAHFIKQKKPVSREKLAKELNIIGEYQLEGFRRRLCAMERDGQLIFTRHQCYTLPEYFNLLRGIVIGHRDGFGFLRVEGSKDDYYLSIEQMKMVIHGDIVIAKSQGIDRKGRREAIIIRIIVPKTSQIVGRFLTDSNNYFVVPDDSRLSFDILIPLKETQDACIGHIVVVELIKRQTRYTKAIGKIIEVIGNSMNIDIAVNIALRTHDIPYIWPIEVKKQIADFQESVPEAAKHGRIDLRELPLVTIDGEDAFDFDDAVYCEKKSNGGWQLWVAISDVSYYVRPYTALDKEANRRATSIYFPLQVIPMLPEVLSNGLCSLNPKVDRLCIVCEMTISAQGYLSSYRFYEAVMNSYARLTYNKVCQILQRPNELKIQYPMLVKPIIQLNKMYQALKQARVQRGGILFETEEAKFIFNTEHRIESIEPTKRNNAHKLIEECMILANIAAAKFIEKYKEPALYRVHDRPSNDNIISLRAILGKFGLTLGGGDKPESKDYANIINLVSDRIDHEMLQTILLRSMKQAIYDPKNRGHFGLALQSYAHFTSPIRRYSDLSLHRAIKYLLNRKNVKTNDCSTPTGGFHAKSEEILQLGQQCSLSERRADEAMRDVSDWLKCHFMKDRIGGVFYGIITSVTSFGFFVRLYKFFIDGLVHISSLENDYYRYDNIGQVLIGESGSRIYRLGDTVKIRVEAVHMNERKIDFSLILKYRKSRDISKKIHSQYNTILL